MPTHTPAYPASPIITLGAFQPNPSDSSFSNQPAPSASNQGATPSVGANPTLGPTPNTPANPGASPSGNMFLFMLPLLGLMIFMTFWSSRKEKKKREEMASALGKGDQVQLIGGEIGTVLDIGDSYVIVRFEDTTKIKYVKSAVQVILKSAKAKDTQAVEAKSTNVAAKA